MTDRPAPPFTVYGLALQTVAHVPIDQLPDELSRRMRGAAELLAVADALELPPGSPSTRRLAALLELEADGELAGVMLSEVARAIEVRADGWPGQLDPTEARGIARLAGVVAVLDGIRGILTGETEDLPTLERHARRACTGVGDPVDLSRLWDPSTPAG